jgi:hypothetical protein
MRKLLAAVCALGLFSLSGQGQDEAPPPSPKEITQALSEYKDALASLRTAERALEASAKKLEALVKRVPQQPATPNQILPGAPAPNAPVSGNSYYVAPPANPPAPQPQAPVAVSEAPARDATQDMLKAVLDRLERMEQRLADIEKAQKK